MAQIQEVPTGGTKGMKLTAEDRRWREEDDVRTLAEAKIIEDDPKRLAAARKRAVAMAKGAGREGRSDTRGRKLPETDGQKEIRRLFWAYYQYQIMDVSEW